MLLCAWMWSSEVGVGAARPAQGKTRRQGDSRDTEGKWNRWRVLAHEEVARLVGAPTLADDMETQVNLAVE